MADVPSAAKQTADGVLGTSSGRRAYSERLAADGTSALNSPLVASLHVPSPRLYWKT